MKAQRRLRRSVRALALTGCLSALLATPTVAGAMPIKGDVPASPAPPTLLHPHGVPASQAPFTLPSGFKTDAQTRAPAISTAPASRTVLVRHVAADTDHTLAIVLASVALAIALCGTAYAGLRVTRIQRRVVGSGS